MEAVSAVRTPLTMAASSLSALNCGVEVLELDAGILSGEAPINTTTGAVARRLPRRDLPLQRRPVMDPGIWLWCTSRDRDRPRCGGWSHARRTRLRSRSNFARPYIWRLSILIRLTLPYSSGPVGHRLQVTSQTGGEGVQVGQVVGVD